MNQIENTITAPLQHLELVVQPFDKTAVGPFFEVIGDFFPPSLQGFQKRVEALQAALPDPLDPIPDLSLPHSFGQVLIKDSGQVLAQSIGLLQLWGMLEQLAEHTALFGG